MRDKIEIIKEYENGTTSSQIATVAEVRDGFEIDTDGVEAVRIQQRRG